MIWGKGYSLRTLLIGQFLLVTLVAAVTALILLVFWRLPAARHQREVEQSRSAQMVLQQFDGVLDTTESLVQAMSRLVVQEGISKSRRATLDLIPRLASSTGLFDSLYLLDSAGRISAVGTALDYGKSLRDWVGTDLSGLSVVKTVLQEHHLIWSQQFQSPLFGAPTIALGVPVGENVLLAELSIDRLVTFARLASQQDRLLVLITDSKGEVIVAPETQQLQTRSNLSNNPLINYALKGGQIFGEFDFAGQDYSGTAVQSARLGWTILVAYPSSIANQTTRIAITITSVTLLISISFGVYLFIILSNRIDKQLNRAVSYAQSVAQAQYKIPENKSNILELQALNISLTQMASAIQGREQQLKAIVDTSPNVAIQWLDKYGRVLDWNPASESLFGWSRQEACGLPLDNLYLTSEQNNKFLKNLTVIESSGKPCGPDEIEIKTRNGDLRSILSTTFLVPDLAGDNVFVSMGIDITDKLDAERKLRNLNIELELRIKNRTENLSLANTELQQTLDTLKRLQKQLVLSEKLASLGALVAGISHELNTPIGNGLMAISTLNQRSKSFRAQVATGLRRSELEKFLQQVEQASTICLRNLERAAELVVSFKRVAVDQTSSQRREFELAELVQEVLMTLRPTIKKCPFKVKMEVNIPVIKMNSFPGPLGQVISNLVQNSLIHAFEGRKQGEILISARQVEDHIDIIYEDDGVGIPDQLVNRIFDPFFTTRMGEGGSGLGLHIVHTIVSGVLGGHIEVLHREGGGVRFVINCALVSPIAPDDSSKQD